jgi:hypothetical protein
MPGRDIIVIGASAGGLDPLRNAREAIRSPIGRSPPRAPVAVYHLCKSERCPCPCAHIMPIAPAGQSHFVLLQGNPGRRR